MKIACITTSVIPSRSANSIQVMKVVHALKQAGQDVRLWVPEFERADWAKLADTYGLSTGFDTIWLPFNQRYKQYDFCFNAVSAALRWGADVVYTWALQAALMARLANKPSVMEFHDFPMGRNGPLLFRLYSRLKGKKLLLFTTRALAQGMQQRFRMKLDEDALQIAPNGAETERYQSLPTPEEARGQLGLPEGFTVGYTGHFYPGRGMDLLNTLVRSMPDMRFLWVGGRPEDLAPWQYALMKDKIENVTITGFIPNSRLPLYQAAADVLVMPYQKKISGSSGGDIAGVINPMKMFDYLASGRPIVASDIPVFHEVLDEATARFCPSEDTAAWQAAIRALQADPGLRGRMGAAGQAAAERYTWRARAGQTLKKLEKLIQ